MRNHFQKEEIEEDSGFETVLRVLFGVALLIDDVTVVGFVNDSLAIACIMIAPNYSKMVCSVCGEVLYGIY